MEPVWEKAGIPFILYGVGGGSAEFLFESQADKERARELTAKEIIADFDIED
jgi:hypothetical protein